MPSSATITAFYSFTANTKARSSQVNSNFSLFRGHIIPIDPNTATGADNTYDLGSTEYRFRNLYLKPIAFTTSSESFGIARSAYKYLSVQFTSTALSPVEISGLTITLNVVKGRPLRIGFTTPLSSEIGSTLAGYFILGSNNAALAEYATMKITVLENNSTIGSFTMNTYQATASANSTDYYPSDGFSLTKIAETTTSNNYSFQYNWVSIGSDPTLASFVIHNVVSQAYQW